MPACRAGLPPSTGYTIVVPELLLEELERVRRPRLRPQRRNETEIGMSSLAVPVHVPLDGPVVAAISMIGPTARVMGDHEPHHTSVLLAGARKLGESIEKGEYSLRRRRP